jgi:hypothetical protein
MFLVAVLAMIVVSVGAYYALNTIQKPVDVAFATQAARIDPGE